MSTVVNKLPAGILRTIAAPAAPSTPTLAIGVGNIRVKTLHDDFNGWSIEIDRKFKLTVENWKSLNRLAEISVDSVAYF